MRDIPVSMSTALQNGMFIGEARPTARVTVQHQQMKLRSYSMLSTFTEKFNETSIKAITEGKYADAGTFIDFKKGHKVHTTYADFLFTNLGRPFELPNVKSVSWTRSIDQDAADCTIELFNSKPQQIMTSNQQVGTVRVATTGPLPALRGRQVVDGINVSQGDRVLVRNQGTAQVNAGTPNGVYVAQPGAWTKVSGDGWYRVLQGKVNAGTVFHLTYTAVNSTKPSPGDLDLPGYYTYSRGASLFSNPTWGHTINEWFGLLMPDNIIRTYEGYGSDRSQPPESDGLLVQTGTWMIDSVDMAADGTMTLKCRDLGRLLMEQYFSSPIVSKDILDAGDWTNWDDKFTISTAAQRLKVTWEDSSNTPWLNSKIKGIAGHTTKMAFDNNPNSYWLSVGNALPSKRYAYEWVQCKVGNQSVSQVRVRPKKSGYTCYVSVMVNGVWQGKETINYHRDGIGQNGGNIRYVKKVNLSSEKEAIIDLGKTYKKVQRVRVTFGNLQNFGFGDYKYRAGIREVGIYMGATSTQQGLTPGPAGSNPNRYSDYTDIVKLICAWAGFFWPDKAKQRVANSTGGFRHIQPGAFDYAVLGKGVRGRIWGELMDTGTTGQVDLGLDNFTNKTLRDCITYIQDAVGFIFFIDETGGVQWRFPNTMTRGCYRGTLSANPGYVDDFYHPIHEGTNLISMTATLDSKNVREMNLVGDAAGKLGAYSPGFNPNYTGLRRYLQWTDGEFAPEKPTKVAARKALAEAQMTADLITLRQLFSYRTDRVQIPGNPAIQIDDQVRITERVTDEGYIHYVKGISSSLDMESGQWTYDLDTNWLGYDPKSIWIWKPTDLSDDAKRFVELQRQLKTRYKNYDRRSLDDLTTGSGTTDTDSSPSTSVLNAVQQQLTALINAMTGPSDLNQIQTQLEGMKNKVGAQTVVQNAYNAALAQVKLARVKKATVKSARDKLAALKNAIVQANSSGTSIPDA